MTPGHKSVFGRVAHSGWSQLVHLRVCPGICPSFPSRNDFSWPALVQVQNSRKSSHFQLLPQQKMSFTCSQGISTDQGKCAQLLFGIPGLQQPCLRMFWNLLEVRLCPLSPSSLPEGSPVSFTCAGTRKGPSHTLNSRGLTSSLVRRMNVSAYNLHSVL